MYEQKIKDIKKKVMVGDIISAKLDCENLIKKIGRSIDKRSEKEKKNPLNIYIADLLIILSNIQRKMTLSSKAEDNSLVAYKIYKNIVGPNDNRTINAQINVAKNYYYNGKINEAIVSLKTIIENSIRIYGQGNQFEAESFLVLASINMVKKEFDKAVRQLDTSLKICEQFKSKSITSGVSLLFLENMIINIYILKSEAHLMKGELDKAHFCATIALKTCFESPNTGSFLDHSLLYESYLLLHEIYKRKEDHQTSIDLINEAYEYAKDQLPKNHPTLVKIEKIKQDMEEEKVGSI